MDNELNVWYEYINDQKVYMGHKPKWYYQIDASDEDEILGKLIEGVRKFVNHAVETGCVKITREEMIEELYQWFEEDSNLEECFPEYLEDGDHTFDEILDGSLMFIDSAYEYDGDKKIFLGRYDSYYFDKYQPNMTAEEIIEMLAHALKKYVEDCKELECEQLTEEQLYGVLGGWLEHDLASKGYFEAIEDKYNENGDQIEGDEFDQIIERFEAM